MLGDDSDGELGDGHYGVEDGGAYYPVLNPKVIHL